MPNWLRALERGALLTLPALAVIVATTGLVVGSPRPVLYARGRGGPTVGTQVLSFRLEVREHTADGDRRWTGTARVEIDQASGQKMQWSGRTDDEGLAEVRFEPATPFQGPIRARVYAPSSDREDVGAHGARPITEAIVAVTREEWVRAGPGTAAWVSHRDGDLTIAAAATRGAFAVPFEDDLLVKVLISDRKEPGVRIAVSAEGAETLDRESVTDEDGFVHVRVRPLLHDAHVTLEARAASGQRGKLVVALPVVPGAIHVQVQPDVDTFHLFIESPVPRERAYLAFVSDEERIAGVSIPLLSDSDGTATGYVAAAPGGLDGREAWTRPIWVVVSSEPDLLSPGAVGWPILATDLNEARPTFDVPDVLWFDGKSEAVARDTARMQRARTLGAIISGMLLLCTGFLVARRAAVARRDAERLDDELADTEATSPVAASRSRLDWLIAAAVLSLVMAIVLVVVFALLK